LENRFRRIKADAKLINNAVKDGVDVITINVGDTNGAIAVGKGTAGFFYHSSTLRISFRYLRSAQGFHMGIIDVPWQKFSASLDRILPHKESRSP
jgi:hypothetical protein